MVLLSVVLMLLAEPGRQLVVVAAGVLLLHAVAVVVHVGRRRVEPLGWRRGAIGVLHGRSAEAPHLVCRHSGGR